MTFDESSRPASGHVTIGLLVHNAEGTLRETVDSVLAQTHSNFTLVLSDDGSTDASAEICREYARSDARVRVQVHASNVGAISNFNSVVPFADGDYFVWMSDHDLWLPDYLGICVAALERRPEAVLCYTSHTQIDLAGRAIPALHPKLDTTGQDLNARVAMVAWGVPRITASVYGVMRVSELRGLKSYPTIYPRSVGPDYVMLLELAVRGEFLHVDEPLYLLRYISDEHVSPHEHLGRLHLIPRSRIDAVRKFARMISLAGRALWFQVPGVRHKVLLVSVFLLSATHYDFLLRLMIDVGARQGRARAWRGSDR